MTSAYFIRDHEVPLGVECAWQPPLPRGGTGYATAGRGPQPDAILVLACGLWRTIQAAYVRVKARLVRPRTLRADGCRRHGAAATAGRRC